MISRAIEIVQQAESEGAFLSDLEKSILTGFSGEKLIGVLQRLGQLVSEHEDSCYTEIGVFQGLTLLSVARAAPSLPCFGIDNFSQLDPDGENFSIVRERRQKLDIQNAKIIDKDFEEALENFESFADGRKIGVLFVDGPHDYRSQMLSILLAKPHLHEHCAIVIDDSNYQHVRQANHDFLKAHTEFKLLFEAYTPSHPVHLQGEELASARAGWWNGVNIIVRDPENGLEPIFPDTSPQSKCFLNEHIVHAHRYGELAEDALNFLGGMEKPLHTPIELVRLIRSFARFNDARGASSLTTNTFSGHLTASRFARARQ